MASVATIPTFYLLGRKMVNGRFGIVCAVVVAFASELILQPVQLNMLSIALLIIGVGTWLALKRNLLSMPLIAWGLSFEGTNVRNMGVLLFNNKEVSWAIVAMAIVATVIVIKKNGWEWDKDWLVVPSGIILGLINPICWVVVVVLITAFVGHVLISLVPNKELLLWIGIGVMGFWSLQNWDLVKTKNNYKVFIEAKAFIDKIYPDPAGKIKFFELDNSKASVLPLMYMYSQAGRLSEEGTPVIIFHDPVQIQIYLWRQGIEGYVRSVAALDVFNNKY